jgi:hypothetical protein
LSISKRILLALYSGNDTADLLSSAVKDLAMLRVQGSR